MANGTRLRTGERQNTVINNGVGGIGEPPDAGSIDGVTADGQGGSTAGRYEMVRRGRHRRIVRERARLVVDRRARGRKQRRWRYDGLAGVELSRRTRCGQH